MARHVQFGVFVPTGFADNATAFNFNIDKVTIATPEPTTAALSILGLIGAAGIAGTRSRKFLG